MAKPKITNLLQRKTELRGQVLPPGGSIDVDKVYSSVERAAADFELRSKAAAGELKTTGIPGFKPLAPPAQTPTPPKTPQAAAAKPPPPEPDPEDLEDGDDEGEDEAEDWGEWQEWSAEMLYKLAQRTGLKGRSKIEHEADSLVVALEDSGAVTDEALQAVLSEYE